MQTAFEVMTGGEAAVRSLLANGVTTLFALPGIQNDWLFNALYDHRDRIRVIHTRHEQGAAFMALGAALATGELAVCSVVPGPGVLNAATALATAYALNAKLLFLTGGIPLPLSDRKTGALHEINDPLGCCATSRSGPCASKAPRPFPQVSMPRSMRFIRLGRGPWPSRFRWTYSPHGRRSPVLRHARMPPPSIRCSIAASSGGSPRCSRPPHAR